MADLPPPPPLAGSDDAELQRLLQQALTEYERHIADLEAGRIDATEFQTQVFRSGLVIRNDEAWLFNLQGGYWCRYDGVSLAALGDPPEEPR